MADNSHQVPEAPPAGGASPDGNGRLSGRNSPAIDVRAGPERRDPPQHDSHSDLEDTLDQDGQPQDLTVVSRVSSGPAYSHSDLEDTLDQDGQPQDLTVVSRVSSGPAYSAFSSKMKMWIVAMNCFSAFISPMTANIYFPALPTVARDLGVSIGQVNLSLTTFQIFQGLAPTVFGDLGDGAGRRPAFIIAMVIYLGANIGLALQRDYAALLILRMLQSGGSSGTLAMVYAVVADIAPSSERGRYMGIVGAGLTVGPALGPVIGGLLTQYLGWPSIFWFLTIVSVVFLVPYILAVPETGRKIVGNGSIPPQGWNMTLLDHLRARRSPAYAARPRVRTKIPVPNPFNTLRVLAHKDMAMILLYNAMVYIGFQTFASTLATQFSAIYHLSDIQLGLCYLPFGVACTIASISQGFILDWNYRRTAKKLGIKIDRKRGNSLKDFPIERVRIQVVRPLLLVGAAAYIAYGWVMQAELHVAIPLTLSFFIGLCVAGSFQVINTLIVDLYPEAPATATAANNLTRCLLGAVSTALIEKMIQAMGRGWAYTLIALIFTVTSPTLWVVQKYGPKYREQRRLKTLEEAKKKEVQETGAPPDAAMVGGPNPNVPETSEKRS